MMYFGTKKKLSLLVTLSLQNIILLWLLSLLSLAVDDNPIQVHWFLNLFTVLKLPILVLFTGIIAISITIVKLIIMIGAENALSRESKSDDELTSGTVTKYNFNCNNKS